MEDLSRGNPCAVHAYARQQALSSCVKKNNATMDYDHDDAEMKRTTHQNRTRRQHHAAYSLRCFTKHTDSKFDVVWQMPQALSRPDRHPIDETRGFRAKDDPLAAVFYHASRRQHDNPGLLNYNATTEVRCKASVFDSTSKSAPYLRSQDMPLIKYAKQPPIKKIRLDYPGVDVAAVISSDEDLD